MFIDNFENKMTYNTKHGSSLKLVTPKTQVLVERDESKIIKDHFGFFVILSIKKYQRKWKGLFRFLTIKALGKLFGINPSSLIF